MPVGQQLKLPLIDVAEVLEAALEDPRVAGKFRAIMMEAMEAVLDARELRAARLSKEESARFLGMSVRTFERYCEEDPELEEMGKAGAGGRRRWPKSDLAAWKARRKR